MNSKWAVRVVGILLNYRLNPLQRQRFALDTDHTKIYHGLPRKISARALPTGKTLDSAIRGWGFDLRLPEPLVTRNETTE